MKGSSKIASCHVARDPNIRKCVRVDVDRKSTRLNSSHLVISYAVFCLKKKIHDYRTPHQETWRFLTKVKPDYNVIFTKELAATHQSRATTAVNSLWPNASLYFFCSALS